MLAYTVLVMPTSYEHSQKTLNPKQFARDSPFGKWGDWEEPRSSLPRNS